MTLNEARRELNITVDLLPVTNSNRPGRELVAQHVTIHNTDNAAAGADARAHAIYMKGRDAQQREVSWHFTVDDRAVFQSLPVREVGWHAGRGNSRSIGVEICENRGIDQATANRRAALLTAVLLRENRIPLEGGVVQHHFWTEKDCPHLLRRGNGWSDFLSMVARFYAELDQDRADECTVCGHDDGDEIRRGFSLGAPAAEQLEAGRGNRGDGDDQAFSTEAARSANGSGSSETSGLRGTITNPSAGVRIIDATERLHAVREGRDLGRKSARQVRTKRGEETVVTQGDYCWQERELPSAVLIENSDGFNGAAGVIQGRATYFGKYDEADEGTGSPLFKIVHTNSSVFAMSLPRATLLRHGLAREVDGILRSTEKGLTALVEVYFGRTRRMMKLPLADVGPAPRTGAVADLTAAAVAWLLNREEREADGYQLPNPQVEVRIPE